MLICFGKSEIFFDFFLKKFLQDFSLEKIMEHLLNEPMQEGGLMCVEWNKNEISSFFSWIFPILSVDLSVSVKTSANIIIWLQSTFI
jgi:hypothetical protein